MSSISIPLRSLLQNPSTIKSSYQAKQLHAQVLKTEGNALMNMYCKFQSINENFDSQRFSSGGVDSVYEKIPDRKVTNFGCNLDIKMDTEKDPYPIRVLGKNQNQLLVTGGGTPRGRQMVYLESVKKVFDIMSYKDIVSWNTVIAGYVHNGMCEEALRTVREIGKANLMPDSFTLSSILPIFADYVDISKGKEIHGYTLRHGFDSDDFIASSLIDMYAKCTRVDDSLRIFHLLPQLDVILWNSIIAGCVQNGLFDEVNLQFLLIIRSPGVHTESQWKAISPTAADLSLLNQSKVKLESCSLVVRERLRKGSCRSRR
ncbi:hypothetical protein MKX01_008454 [Papaver californicum]|nr:hypothetical protein MKX01_008454 [Papaver californicum]